jgi:hypothetical protein
LFTITDTLKLRFQHTKGEPLKVHLENEKGEAVQGTVSQVAVALKAQGFKYVTGTNGVWGRA